MPHKPNLLPDEKLALLNRISQGFNTSLQLDEVLTRVIDEVIAAVHAERGLIVVLEEALEPPYDLSRCEDIRDLLKIFIAHGIDQQTIASDAFSFSRTVMKKVLCAGQALLTDDAQKDERLSEAASVIMLNLHSILCVPLMAQQNILGAIYVDNRVHAGIFTQGDLELLTTIAFSAASAIDNARLYQKTLEHVQRLNALNRISQHITQTLDLDRVLTITIQAVRDLLGASAASILTLEDDTLVFQVAVGEKSEAIKPFRIPASQGLAGWVVQNRQPVVVNDARLDERMFKNTDDATGFITQSIAAAPMIVNERAIGVLEVVNKPGGFSQKDVELLVTVASSAAFAIENARLYQLAVEKGRMEREMKLALAVQSSLLPARTPEIPGWEFAACWLPARYVAGDYYDFIPIAQKEGGEAPIGIVIADVADKGMPAALFMAMARSTLRASLYSSAAPDQAITRANQLICADSPNSMFITLAYAQINPSNGKVTYVNGGHNTPFLCSPSPHSTSPKLAALDLTGIPLGIDDTRLYSQKTTQLEPGEFIIFYTDGVVDALNENQEAFGLRRLKEAIHDFSNLSAVEIVAGLEAALQAFIGCNDPFDDITVVVAKRLQEKHV